MPGIFVSYRRDDAAGWAGRLSADLREGLRGAAVFMDIDAIPPGVPYDDYIAQAVGSCDVLIALIGPRWLTVTDKAGRRRLDDPSDLTRLEILAALQRNIRVIPALVGGAEMPLADELPDALKPLARRQAYELADHRWNEDCARLVQVLKPIVGGGTSAGKRVVAGAGLVLALLVAGFGVKLWLDQRPDVNPTPVPTGPPTVAPTATPTPIATPEPTPIAPPSPTPVPSPTATSAPSPSPTTVRTPEPTPVVTPAPTTPPASKPRIALSPLELDFGSGAVGAKPTPKRFFIKNLTDTTLRLTYAVRGVNPREFPPITSDCDPALKGGMVLTVKGCYLGLGFVPAEVGLRGAVAEVVILDHPGERHRVVLSGTGRAPDSQADEKAALKMGAKCTRSSATAYEVEIWGSARGPADAMLAVEIQMRTSKAPPKLISQDHSCGAWKSLNEGRSICARANVATASTDWRYRSSLVTKDVPATAIAFVWSDKQRERSQVPLTCAGKP